jgi:hypothetical protein
VVAGKSKAFKSSGIMRRARGYVRPAFISILMRARAPTAPTTKDFTTCSFLGEI